MSEIDHATVEQVAKLSRIRLTKIQLEQSAQQLASVFKFIENLDAADVSDDLKPFFGAIESVNAVRDDAVVDSEPRESILSNAPETDGEFYVVPPVFK